MKLEVSVDPGLTDIVASRFDAGIRLGEQVAKEMVAVPIGPPLRMAVVGTPGYFAKRAVPKIAHDLTQHACIDIRMHSSGGRYTWEVGKAGRDLNIRVDGPLVFNNMSMILKAVTEGFGLGCIIDEGVKRHIAKGTLIRVLEDWCAPFPGYHLYYPSRRQSSPAFTLLADDLRYRPSAQSPCCD